MSWLNQKVLVTGAAGFIGSHLVQSLLEAGACVRVMTHYRGDPTLANLELLSSEELSQIEVLRGNIEDPFFVRRAVSGCEIVLHLAALIAIPYSYIAPASYVDTNITGTLNVLEACRQENTPRLVHTSTSECYGTARYTPIDEGHPLQAQSPYSASKMAADKLAESYYCSFGLPVVTIRPFNTYGPRQSGRAVIPTIISQLLAGVRQLKLGSLKPVRDFTYVADTVAGLMAGAKATGVEGQLVNLGFGQGITIGELALKIMELVGRTVPIITEEERLRPDRSEVMALISNNTLAREQLGWQPKISLEDGLSRVIEFIRTHPERYRPERYVV